MIQRFFLYALSLMFTLSCKKNTTPTPPEGPAGISSRVLTEDLQFPWEILWGPDQHLWITERSGKISRVDTSNGSVIPVSTIGEVSSQGEGGMLGMVLHPDFSATPQVFVAYDYVKSGQYTAKVVRYTYAGGALTSPVILIDNIKAASIHNGCRLLISSDNKLYITMGDAADQNLPQNLASRNGKILRIQLDGSIPSDNPDPASPVWSYGHRNPQGLVEANNILYSSEHGPDSDDEVNIIEKGQNYGWPNVRGFCNESGEQSFCTANDVTEPLKNWTPTVAVCGMDFYNQDMIPQWKNSLLLCTLKGSRLLQLSLDGTHRQITGTTEFFADQYGRLRDICISPDGKVYLCTSNGSNDKIIEVTGKPLP